MTDFATLYFSSVSPHESSLAALLLLHDKVWSYAPSEDFSVPENLHWYCRQDLLKIHVPAPLGVDQDSFSRIIQDLWAHGEDFLGASRFAMGGKENVEPGWDIVSSLTGERKESEKDRDFWQARILLAMQEKLDQQQREIDQNLAMLAAKQNSMLDVLRLGEEDSMSPIGHVKQPFHSSQRDKQLLRAWSKLYFADDATDRPFVFATDQTGISSLLLTEYEKLTNESPQKLLELALPDMASIDLESFQEKRLEFQKMTSSCRDELSKMCSVQGHFEKASSNIPDHVKVWCNAVEESFHGMGDKTLIMYRFAGYSMPYLLARCAKLEEEKMKDLSLADGFLFVVTDQG